MYKKARQSVRIAGLFACIRHQNCQPEPGFSYVSAPFGGPVQESAEGRLPPSLSVFGAFVKRQPSALLGRVKSFRFQHRAKREEKMCIRDRRLAASSETGSATVIISGLSLGMLSTVAPVVIVGVSVLISYFCAGGTESFSMGLYGVGVSACLLYTSRCV